MKYCVSCGKPMEESAAFCGACGAKAEEVAPVAAPVAVVTDAPKPRRNVKSLVFSIVGLVLGATSLMWAVACLCVCWLPGMGVVYPFVGFAYAIPGLIFSNLAKADADRDRAKGGRIMSIIGMALFTITFFIGCAALSGDFGGSYDFFDIFEDMFDF